MKKQISKFRIEPYGFFIDLADGKGRIGVDRETGHILLDEGEGADRYHGAVIEPGEFEGMDLRLSAGGDEATVTLSFGGGCSHVLGTTNDPATGRHWMEEVSKVVKAHTAAVQDESKVQGTKIPAGEVGKLVEPVASKKPARRLTAER